MPTGYTAAVADGTITEFAPFAMQCARAMGALIMMRDEPFDAPIPERFEPSSFHRERITEARDRLAWLRALTPAEQDSEAVRAHEENVARRAQWAADRQRENDRYRAMLAQVEAWEPPSGDHAGFKDFMLQQLRDSIIQYEEPEPARLTAAEWYARALSNAIHEERMAAEENDAEIARTENRNEWLRQLRESLA